MKHFDRNFFSLLTKSLTHSLTRRGFSLLEVAIAVAILAVGLVGAMRVFPVGLRASFRSDQASRAAFLAQQTLERTKLISWEALEPGETAHQDGPFSVTLVIDQPTLDGLVDSSRLKRLSVHIGWSQDGRERSVSAVTYVVRPLS